MIFLPVIRRPVTGSVGHKRGTGLWWVFMNVMAHGTRFVTMFIVAVSTTTTVMTFQITHRFVVQVVTMMTLRVMTQFSTQCFPHVGQFVS